MLAAIWIGAETMLSRAFGSQRREVE